MSDRTSAVLFGDILRHVLEPDPNATPRNVALRFMEYSQKYDFCLYQMYAEEVLIRHDLVRWRRNAEFGQWERVYAHEDGFDVAEPDSDSDVPHA